MSTTSLVRAMKLPWLVVITKLFGKQNVKYSSCHFKCLHKLCLKYANDMLMMNRCSYSLYNWYPLEIMPFRIIIHGFMVSSYMENNVFRKEGFVDM